MALVLLLGDQLCGSDNQTILLTITRDWEEICALNILTVITVGRRGDIK